MSKLKTIYHLKDIPKFKSLDEEADFWDTHQMSSAIWSNSESIHHSIKLDRLGWLYRTITERAKKYNENQLSVKIVINKKSGMSMYGVRKPRRKHTQATSPYTRKPTAE